MSTADEVRKLSHLPASAIARQLGLSRQRIYHVCKKEGIALLPYHEWAGADRRPRLHPPRKPKARLITGGVPQDISHAVAGTISELLVAADLMARGWQVFRPLTAATGHDIIAVRKGTILTIEVRSAHANNSGRLIYNKKADCKSAHYGLVVTGQPVTYEPDLPD